MMSIPVWLRRVPGLISAMVVAILAALWPGRAFADCSPLDMGGCMAGAQYQFWYGLASLGWWIDRSLLTAAYQVDTLRWWIAEVAFTSAYSAITATLSPVLAPVATLAVVIGCLLFLLMPLTGRLRVVSIRHALIWAALAPLLLTVSGPLIVQSEQVRTGVGGLLYAAVSAATPGAIFGAAGSDMRAPTPLYPSNPCGTTILLRRSGAGLRLDELAASLLWADAEDIHCPSVQGPGRDIPDAFYIAAPAGGGFATDQDVFGMQPTPERDQTVVNMSQGAVRTLIGIIPGAVALAGALVDLLFALCLIAAWLSLPIGLVFVFFDAGTAVITSLFRRLILIFQVSWSASALMGLLSACMIAAAQLRNAAAYTGFALAGGVLVVYLLQVAVKTLFENLSAMSTTMQTATGLSPAAAFTTGSTLALGAVGSTAALASGSAAAALVASAAYRASGSTGYAAATALGRIQPVAQLGEVAAALGVLNPDSDIGMGLYAGQRSRTSLRAGRMHIVGDSARTDPYGRSMRDRAEEQRISHAMARAEHPTIVEEITSAATLMQHGYAYLGSNAMAHDLFRVSEHVAGFVRAGYDRLHRQANQMNEAIQTTSHGSSHPLQIASATIQVADQYLRPYGKTDGHDRQRFYKDQRGSMQARSALDPVPAHAHTQPRSAVHIARLLQMGYMVQELPDDQIAFWKAEQSSDQSASALPEALAMLVRAGALRPATANTAGRSSDISCTPVQTSPPGPMATPDRALLRQQFLASADSQQYATLDPTGMLVWTPTHPDIPAGACSLAADQIDAGQLLGLGYAVQQQHTTVTFWKPGQETHSLSMQAIEQIYRELEAAGAFRAQPAKENP